MARVFMKQRQCHETGFRSSAKIKVKQLECCEVRRKMQR